MSTNSKNKGQRKSKNSINKKGKSETMTGLLKQIRDLESYNKGATFKDPVVFPDGRTFDSQIYNIIVTAETTSYITSSTTNPVFGSLNFTLSQIDDFPNLAAIFDQYRVKMLQYVFYPRQDSSTGSAVSGLLHTVIDYDDSTGLSSVGQALDYSNCLITPGDTKQVRTFVPHAADALYSGAFTSFGNVTSPWCDAASSGIVHYGIKLAIPTSAAATTYDVICRAWLQFRSQR